MFSINKLDRNKAKDYALFTYPYLRNNLEEYCDNENKVILAASCLSKAVGLIVAELNAEKNLGTINSIYVSLAYRKRELGRRLLGEAEKELFDKGCRSIDICFPSDENHMSPLSIMLKNNGWTDFLKVYEITKFQISNYPWVKKFPLKENSKMLPFEDISSEQLEYVKKGINKWYPAYASPFGSRFDNYHRDTSFWFMVDGEIVGWVITLLLSKDTLSYERFYIREDLRRKGISFPFVAAIPNKQLSLGIPYGSMLINYNEPYVNLPLKKFYERKVRPDSIFYKEYYVSSKNFEKDR